jgi:hypothetical protein
MRTMLSVKNELVGENIDFHLFLDDQQDQCWPAILHGNLAQSREEGDDKQAEQEKAIGYQQSGMNAQGLSPLRNAYS